MRWCSSLVHRRGKSPKKLHWRATSQGVAVMQVSGLVSFARTFPPWEEAPQQLSRQSTGAARLPGSDHLDGWNGMPFLWRR